MNQTGLVAALFVSYRENSQISFHDVRVRDERERGKSALHFLFNVCSFISQVHATSESLLMINEILARRVDFK